MIGNRPNLQKVYMLNEIITAPSAQINQFHMLNALQGLPGQYHKMDMIGKEDTMKGASQPVHEDTPIVDSKNLNLVIMPQSSN